MSAPNPSYFTNNENRPRMVKGLTQGCTGYWWQNSGLQTRTSLHDNHLLCISVQKPCFRDFPGGAVVGSPPANAGGTGSSLGPGRSHMPRSGSARAPQLLSLRSRAHVPQLLRPAHLEPVLCNGRGHRNEKLAHRRRQRPPLAATGKGPHAAMRTQCSRK